MHFFVATVTDETLIVETAAWQRILLPRVDNFSFAHLYFHIFLTKIFIFLLFHFFPDIETKKWSNEKMREKKYFVSKSED